MTIGLWTKEGSGYAYLDTSRKVEGVSSLRIAGGDRDPGITLTRKYFACQSFRITFDARLDFLWEQGFFRFIASEYGKFNVLANTDEFTWEKRRATFLWDKTTESKWYRLEIWNGAAWALVHGDTALGDEEPGNSTFGMDSRWNASYAWYPVNIDAMTCEVLA